MHNAEEMDMEYNQGNFSMLYHNITLIMQYFFYFNAF